MGRIQRYWALLVYKYDSPCIWMAIVLVKDDGKIIDVHPARVRFRGFDEDSNTIGYKNVAKYMKEESDQIFKEAANQDE